MFIKEIDHIQLAMPERQEDQARAFYVDLLGFVEVQKPKDLRGRGGLWLVAETIKLHLGVEKEFRPARKAHPAFLVDNFAKLAIGLETAGYPVQNDIPIDEHERFFSEDCFGNRLEFLALRSSTTSNPR